MLLTTHQRLLKASCTGRSRGVYVFSNFHYQTLKSCANIHTHTHNQNHEGQIQNLVANGDGLRLLGFKEVDGKCARATKEGFTALRLSGSLLRKGLQQRQAVAAGGAAPPHHHLHTLPSRAPRALNATPARRHASNSCSRSRALHRRHSLSLFPIQSCPAPQTQCFLGHHCFRALFRSISASMGRAPQMK